MFKKYCFFFVHIKNFRKKSPTNLCDNEIRPKNRFDDNPKKNTGFCLQYVGEQCI